MLANDTPLTEKSRAIRGVDTGKDARPMFPVRDASQLEGDETGCRSTMKKSKLRLAPPVPPCIEDDDDDDDDVDYNDDGTRAYKIDVECGHNDDTTSDASSNNKSDSCSDGNKRSFFFSWKNVNMTAQQSIGCGGSKKQRKKEKTILSNVSGSVHPYQLTAIMGHSGAGESSKYILRRLLIITESEREKISYSTCHWQYLYSQGRQVCCMFFPEGSELLLASNYPTKLA